MKNERVLACQRPLYYFCNVILPKMQTNLKYLAWLRNSKSDLEFFKKLLPGVMESEMNHWLTGLNLLKQGDTEPDYQYLFRLEKFDWPGLFDFIHRLAEHSR